MSLTRNVTAEIFSILIVPPKKRDRAVGSDTRRHSTRLLSLPVLNLPSQRNTPGELRSRFCSRRYRASASGDVRFIISISVGRHLDGLLQQEYRGELRLER